MDKSLTIDKHLIAFISSHGILDMYESFHYWIPIYSFIIFLFTFLELYTIHFFVYLGSIYHFSKDLDVNPMTTTLISFPLLYYRNYRLSQRFILYYLSFIHTPLAYYHFFKKYNLDLCILSLTLLTYISVFKIKRFNDTLQLMINNPGVDIQRYEQKLFLSILFSHILVQSNKI